MSFEQEQVTTQEQPVVEQKKVPEISQQVKSGASWFYWIAGLSMVNTLIAAFGGQVSFIVGLGITQFVDAIILGLTENISGVVKTISMFFMVGLDLAFAGMFLYFGIKASQGKRWAFVTGMIFYTGDSLLYLIAQDWFGFGFHIFALVMIFTGLKAIGKAEPLTQGA